MTYSGGYPRKTQRLRPGTCPHIPASSNAALGWHSGSRATHTHISRRNPASHTVPSSHVFHHFRVQSVPRADGVLIGGGLNLSSPPEDEASKLRLCGQILGRLLTMAASWCVRQGQKRRPGTRMAVGRTATHMRWLRSLADSPALLGPRSDCEDSQ